nr:MAG TPA_asm: hypothetical protein [Caudoviricetes sp.]
MHSALIHLYILLYFLIIGYGLFILILLPLYSQLNIYCFA